MTDSTLDAMSALGSPTGDELLYATDAVADYKVTLDELKAFIYDIVGKSSADVGDGIGFQITPADYPDTPNKFGQIVKNYDNSSDPARENATWMIGYNVEHFSGPNTDHSVGLVIESYYGTQAEVYFTGRDRSGDIVRPMGFVFPWNDAGDASGNMAVPWSFEKGMFITAPIPASDAAIIFSPGNTMDVGKTDGAPRDVWAARNVVLGNDGDAALTRSAANTVKVTNGSTGIGKLVFSLPTVDPHIVGALWNNGGTITISAG